MKLREVIVVLYMALVFLGFVVIDMDKELKQQSAGVSETIQND